MCPNCKAQIRNLIESEEDLLGDPPEHVLREMERVGPVENARAAVRAVKRSLLRRLQDLCLEEMD